MPANSIESALPFGLARAESRSAPSRLEDEVAELYDAYRAPVFRYLLSLRTPAGEAEEVVQEVFLALFRHLLEGKPRTNLQGWIFRVAHNLAVKNRRRRLREPEFSAARHEPADRAPDPEAQASGSQRQSRLLRVVEALPEQDRNCLSLRAEGLRYREIAEVLEISLGSVANSIERALARLSRADEVNG